MSAGQQGFDWLLNAQVSVVRQRQLCNKACALGANKVGVNGTEVKGAVSGKRETEKAGNSAASSGEVVLLSPLVWYGRRQRARDPRIVVEGAVPAKLMRAKPAALVSQRPQCRDARLVHADVALDFNRVALSLAYYAMRALLMRHSTFAHPKHSTRRPTVGLRHKCCFVACARALSALRDDGQTL